MTPESNSSKPEAVVIVGGDTKDRIAREVRESAGNLDMLLAIRLSFGDPHLTAASLATLDAAIAAAGISPER